MRIFLAVVARDEGRNETSQSFGQKIAQVLLESGHYDVSGFNLLDALSLRADMEDFELREQFKKFTVQDLTRQGRRCRSPWMHEPSPISIQDLVVLRVPEGKERVITFTTMEHKTNGWSVNQENP